MFLIEYKNGLFTLKSSSDECVPVDEGNTIY